MSLSKLIPLRSQKWQKNIVIISSLLIFCLVVAIVLISKITVNILWFQEVGYLSTFLTQSLTQLFLGLFVFLSSGAFLWYNLAVAQRHIQKQKILQNHTNKFETQSPPLNLKALIPIITSFNILIVVSLIYFTIIAIAGSDISLELPNLKPTSSVPLQFNILPNLETILFFPSWLILTLVIILTILVILKTNILLNTFVAYYSGLIALIISQDWFRFLQFFNSVSFAEKDPIFANDLSFYIFQIPLLKLLGLWLQSIFMIAIAIVIVKYLLANGSISDGKFKGLSRFQLRHIYGLVSGLMLVLAGIHWLNRYLILLSDYGVVHGASFTDIHISLPRETAASILTLIISLWLFLKFITGLGKNNPSNFGFKRKTINSLPFSPWPLLFYLIFYGFGLLLAFLVQNTIVEPNELALEQPYIVNNIQATRAAFDLDKIEVQDFNPEGNLNAQDIEENDLTINNIRLWDTRPIIQTNRQLQQIRPYYVFHDGDIDRYNIINPVSEKQYKQVIIAARELDSQMLPQQAQTWVNKHLVYTHGYGFTMSPVNRVAEGGLPFYFIKDIGTEEDPGALNTSSPEIRESIPILRPRIYYGEVTNNYILTNTKVREFDFPAGQENAYHIYDGSGGITISSELRKLLFSVYFRDWRLFLTNNFTKDTRLLFRRDLNTRLKAIAPFLSYDRDPYLVVAKDNDEGLDHLYWLIDSYTISDYYPYSDGGENQFNYIRNSVKVIIDAENGETKFYVTDTEDPLIKVWQKIFPNLFQPLEEMPKDIKAHIRYPIDLFNTQSERLLAYHMTDAQVFYNKEDQWNIPEEIYGSEVRSIQPYYLIMKLPIGQEEEFILLHPYTPISRPNLIAWLAARCDGENYGKLLLYQFPKQRLIFGPDQIEALINQEPTISGQISLWNRQGSKVVQGHLLIIPIEESLLYVEPLYLEADKNSLPTLARVIVVYKNQIIMADSLDNALNSIFSPQQVEDNQPVIRYLEDNIVPIFGE